MPYNLVAPGCSKEDFSKLGSLYSAVAQALCMREDWTFKTSKKASGRFHLLLGEAQATTIPYKLLAGYDSLYPGLQPMVNFYRGFNILCRKTMMVKTLRFFLNAHPEFPSFDSICPQSFLFYPSKKDDSERDQFVTENENNPNTVWILKPSDGCKGHSIMIMDQAENVLQFIDQQQEGSIAWVVQNYLERPILIPRGKRKFDIRVWVLLDENYHIYVYGQGALRVTAKSYEPGNWDDLHSHLSNHCIAETHPDFGQYEPTNEIWYEDFEPILLDITQNRVSFHRDIIPKIHDIVVLSLLSVKDTLMASSSTAYKPFNVFGYDFMLVETASEEASSSTVPVNLSEVPGDGGRSCYTVDGGVDVKLIEINSSPAVADKLLPRFVENLIELVVDRSFPPDLVEEEKSCGRDTEEAVPGEEEELDAGTDEHEHERSSSSAMFPEAFIKVYSSGEDSCETV